MIDPVAETLEAAKAFRELKDNANSDEIRTLAEGLEHLTAAVRAIADPEGAKLAMDWPWSVTDHTQGP